ncbi:uncharacterized protein LOC123259839 isoform X3 [Cotesia glomerata]|uniref:Uncharacterized protein n=1 Tax=Cotesia glomerata TaxID=32391 RepID=A0AAV7J8K7_COTGL|nr:uncharacterized protein LOC123259839 isoform X3 [Cotesia glomerata]KAH0567399.1 hypothetical protein KQX54_009519 [Cotesia glomerata]
MALLRFRVVTIVAAFCYLSIIDSAAITGEVTEKFDRGALNDTPKLNFEHGTEISTSNKTEITICDKQPCAWAIYYPSTRTVYTYITNTCKCPEQKPSCDKTHDDLSISAYVHHCRPRTINSENPEILNEN